MGTKKQQMERRTHTLEFARFLKVENYVKQFNTKFNGGKESAANLLQSVLKDGTHRRVTHITFVTQKIHDQITSAAYEMVAESGEKLPPISGKKPPS